MMDVPLSDLSSLSSGGRRRSTRLQATSTGRPESFDSSTWTPRAEGHPLSARAVQSSRSTRGDESSGNVPQEDRDHADHFFNPSKRTGLRVRNETPSFSAPNATETAMKPVTDEERRTWPGWVELESDPALFNFILREYGVKDVKVQEVLSLDDEMLTFLPKPVYGLIFLFKYRDEEDEDAEYVPKCPNHVWFANQTTTNACATIALLNIIMNVPEIDLGENLVTFKEETRGLKSAYRGRKLDSNNFIRTIHNSFARRIDMLNADLALLNEVEKWKRAMDHKRKKGAKKNSAKMKKDEEDPGFHFIAYVPINGAVWRLDGLQRQPVNLGSCGDDWMCVARTNIYQRIAQYDDDGLQFNLLSLCKSPLRTIPEKIAENTHLIVAVEKTLTTILHDWKLFTEVDESSLVNELHDSFSLLKEITGNTCTPESVQNKLKEVGKDPSTLMGFRQELLTEQTRLQGSYIEEVVLITQQNELAARRKVDYTRIIYNSIKKLAEQGVLKEIIGDLQESGEMMH